MDAVLPCDRGWSRHGGRLSGEIKQQEIDGGKKRQLVLGPWKLTGGGAVVQLQRKEAKALPWCLLGERNVASPEVVRGRRADGGGSATGRGSVCSLAPTAWRNGMGWLGAEARMPRRGWPGSRCRASGGQSEERCGRRGGDAAGAGSSPRRGWGGTRRCGRGAVTAGCTRARSTQW